MSFKASGPKTRPERVKPPPPPSPPLQPTPSLFDIKDDEGKESLFPPSWSARSGGDVKPQPSTQQSSTSKPRRKSTSSVTSTKSSSTASFHSAHFPAEEENQMIDASNVLKDVANKQFAAGDYSSAIGTYGRATGELPSYLNYEMAVLQSNISICHIRLEQWKEAMDAAEIGLKGLERLLPTKKPELKNSKSKDNPKEPEKTVKDTTNINGKKDAKVSTATKKSDPSESNDEDRFVELPDDAAEDHAAETAFLTQLALSDERRTSIHRIRTKLLLRRARAKSSIDPPSWSHLAGAMEDYTLLSTPEYFSGLPVSDQKTVRKMLVELPPKVNEAKDRDVGEMMGKLKELGNGILKPFGLSTDMFKMVQDPATGGYSMSFESGKK